MPPRKVARKVTQQPIEELKRRRTEKKKGKKREKKGKETLTATPVQLSGTQNVATIDTDEHTEVEEPAISSSQSSVINVYMIFIYIIFSHKFPI